MPRFWIVTVGMVGAGALPFSNTLNAIVLRIHTAASMKKFYVAFGEFAEDTSAHVGREGMVGCRIHAGSAFGSIADRRKSSVVH